MTQHEQIWHCAKRDLVLSIAPGREDLFLWEHCRRVAENALHIVALPSVRSGPRLNRVALEAAALYHDAGWAVQFREGAVQRCDVLARSTNETQRELGAILLGQSLGPHLESRTLETAVNTVHRLNEQPLSLPEAQVVSDAEGLDEIGNLALWGLVRRHVLEGKGVDETIRTWKAQREFRFWEARIGGSFQFDAVKQMATHRLARLDAIFNQLASLQAGEDLGPNAQCGMGSAENERGGEGGEGARGGSPNHAAGGLERGRRGDRGARS